MSWLISYSISLHTMFSERLAPIPDAGSLPLLLMRMKLVWVRCIWYHMFNEIVCDIISSYRMPYCLRCRLLCSVFALSSVATCKQVGESVVRRVMFDPSTTKSLLSLPVFYTLLFCSMCNKHVEHNLPVTPWRAWTTIYRRLTTVLQSFPLPAPPTASANYSGAWKQVLLGTQTPWKRVWKVWFTERSLLSLVDVAILGASERKTACIIQAGWLRSKKGKWLPKENLSSCSHVLQSW